MCALGFWIRVLRKIGKFKDQEKYQDKYQADYYKYNNKNGTVCKVKLP